ncbi:MAG: hypothetical protein AB7O97_05480 [Planctomycetota bacterium]
MFLTRKIGSFLRGKATRGQVFVAALLGGVLGFVPGFFLPSDLGGGFAQAPLLILSVVFLVLVLNANLGVFGLVTLLAKLLSLVAMPVSFAIGRALIDGPLQGLFRLLVNAPVTAWFGLEYYATTGGLVLGLFFGTAMGIAMLKVLMSFRRRMAQVEENSERYQKHSSKTWVRFMAWILFGKGKGKKLSWQELTEGRKALPIRVTGVVLVVLIGAGLWVFQSSYSTPLLTENMRTTLTATNGATVDVGRAELSLSEGFLRIDDLAIADSTTLSTDLFAAAHLEADIDVEALLRRRLVIDRLRVSGASTGTPRTTPAERTATAPEPEPAPEPPAGTKTIDDYLKDVDLWKQRLAQAREWIETLSGADEAPPAERTPEEQRRHIEAAVEEYGLAKVTAEHLREDLPLVWIRAIDIEGIACPNLPVAQLDLHVTDLSTNAWLLPQPPKVSVSSPDQALALAFTGPSKAQQGAAIDFALKNLAVDSVFAQLQTGGAAPLRGGTIDLSTKGSLQTHADTETTIDLPLQVTLRGTTFALPGMAPTPVDQLLLPIGLRGAVTSPSVELDDKTLADALLRAGKQELANFVNQQAGKLLGGIPGAGDLIDPNKTPEQMLDDAKSKVEDAAEQARKQAEEAAKKAAEDAAKKAAEEAAKKGLGEGLRGLLPGGRKN